MPKLFSVHDPPSGNYKYYLADAPNVKDLVPNQSRELIAIPVTEALPSLPRGAKFSGMGKVPRGTLVKAKESSLFSSWVGLGLAVGAVLWLTRR